MPLAAAVFRGDVAGLPGFVYVAAADGRVAAENALGECGAAIDLRAVPRVTFTSPQVATVVLAPEQAREPAWTWMSAASASSTCPGHHGVPHRRLDPGRRGEGEWPDPGAQAVAPNAVELLGEATVAVRLGLTIQDVTDSLHPYLTWVEGFKLAVQAFETDVSKLSCCA